MAASLAVIRAPFACAGIWPMLPARSDRLRFFTIVRRCGRADVKTPCSSGSLDADTSYPRDIFRRKMWIEDCAKWIAAQRCLLLYSLDQLGARRRQHRQFEGLVKLGPDAPLLVAVDRERHGGRIARPAAAWRGVVEVCRLAHSL